MEKEKDIIKEKIQETMVLAMALIMALVLVMADKINFYNNFAIFVL